MRSFNKVRSRICKSVRVLQEVGPINVARCFWVRRRYQRLRAQFGFDAWHVSATYWCRRYKREAVSLANSVKPSFVCEVGCGLGEIIGRISAPERIGIDRDPNVVEAARTLTRGVRFVCGSAENVTETSQKPVDILIALNWPHELKAPEFLAMFGGILRSGLVKFILLDELTHPVAHQVLHDYALILQGLAEVVAISTADSSRRLVLMRVLNAADNEAADAVMSRALAVGSRRGLSGNH